MDSGTHTRGQVVVTPLPRDGPTARDCRSLPKTPIFIPSSPASTGSIPEASWPEALEPRAQESLNALLGALLLRAVRCHCNP